MLYALLHFVTVTALLLVPVSAQFGLGNKRKQGTNFQDLQEQAKQQRSDGGLAGLGDFDAESLQKLYADAMNDPETLKYLEQMGDQFGSAMEQLAKMSPEELEKQMEQAMKLLTGSDILDSVISQQDEILRTLEASGTVPPEELAKFKADPDYFELKMRESFDQMQGMFKDPEMVQAMTSAMTGMKELFGSSQALAGEMSKLLEGGDLTDDDKLEEARLQLLSGDFGSNPLLEEMLKSDELKGVLKDPKKWRESVKEGVAGMKGGFGGKDEL